MTIPLSLRFEILQRDGFRCQFCGKQVPETELEVDHIHPRSQGGKDSKDNLVAACRDCNRGKSDRPVDLWARHWSSLVGKFFHTLDAETNKVQWQGRILSEPKPGYYMIQLFEWITGSPSFTGTRLVSLDDLTKGGFVFYLTQEEMVESYKYGGIAN